MKKYKQFLLEKDLEFKRNPTDVEAFKSDIVDISKPVKSADDFINPSEKSPVLDYYGQGKRFNIVDSADLYEITKVIKNIVDKYLTVQSFGHSINVRDNSVSFVGTTEGDDIRDEHLVQVIDGTIKDLVNKRYPGGYKFESDIVKLENGPQSSKYQINITISGKGENPTDGRYGEEQDENLIDDLVKDKQK